MSETERLEACDLLDREGYAVNALPWESSENA